MDTLPPVKDYTLSFLYAAKENISKALKERLPVHTHKALLVKLLELKAEIERRTTTW